MIVGTAGHVDHGKTALVHALTGVDTDRLAEEKRRGVSIDLGFAYLHPADDAVIGFVDVPGHEHFIRNMLAGATGVDFMLLVVAAADGIMPQTVEHLAIFDLLGLRRGIVALTKTVLVSAARRGAVRADIRRLLAETGFAAIEIVDVSATTGDGIATLRSRLAAAAEGAAHDATGLFRLAIDRSFTLRGVGTVVTGTVLSGAVAIGDHVTITPSGLTARVRSIHAQNRPAEHGVAGQRCALNLAGDGITKQAIVRGEMAVAAELHAPTARIDGRLRLLPSEARRLGRWQPARLHHGAVEVGARIVPLTETPLGPGDEGWVQLVLERPIAAAAGDRFVLRDGAAQRTIGGGTFVDLRPPTRRRRTPQRLAQLAAMAVPDSGDAITGMLALPPFYLDLGAFLRDRALRQDRADDDMIRLVTSGTRYAVSRASWTTIERSLIATLSRSHVADSAAKGMTMEALRRAIEPPLPAPLFAAMLEQFAHRGLIVVEGGLVRVAGHVTRLAPAQEALWRKIQPVLSGPDRFSPPRLAEIAVALGIGETDLRAVMKVVAGRHEIEEIAPGRFYLRSAVAEAAAIVADLAGAPADGQFTAAQLRDRLKTGRKAAIELLEYFDRRGITLRRGDLRRVDPRRLRASMLEQSAGELAANEDQVSA